MQLNQQEMDVVKCGECGAIYHDNGEEDENGFLMNCPECDGYDPKWKGKCPACGKIGWDGLNLCTECEKEFGSLFVFSALNEPDEGVQGCICDKCGVFYRMWQVKIKTWMEAFPIAVKLSPSHAKSQLSGGYLCPDCFEKILGRQVTPEEVITEESFI